MFLIVSSAGAIPLLVITFLVLRQFYINYEHKTYRYLETLAKMHADHIDNFLMRSVADVGSIAKSYSYINLTNQSFLEERLQILQSSYGAYYVDLGVIDESGIQVSYAGPYKLEMADYSNTAWYNKAVNSHIYISDVFLGLRNYPHFIVTVRNYWRGKIWLLRATIDFVSFTKIVEDIKIGETGTAFILNKNGEFQTVPREEIKDDVFNVLDLIKGREGNNYIEGVYTNKRGVKRIMIGYPLKNSEWFLIFIQDYDDALSQFNKAKHFAILILLVSCVGIIITALLLSQKMARRLISLDEEKELLSKQVVEAGRLASIGELAAGIAHEINNPVAIMVEEAGWMEDLLDEIDPGQLKHLDEFRRSLKQIRIQGKRCKEITHKLLSFARKTDPLKKDVDVNLLLKDLVSISSQRAKYSKVKIFENYDPKLPKVLASESELQQVFLNMINNALDAMEKTGGSLFINTEASKDKVRIKIKDTGHGIPEAIISKIFDPFFTTKPVGKGTGLGLSICYGIIKKLGGDIEVESSVGVGTTFTISIPIQREEQ